MIGELVAAGLEVASRLLEPVFGSLQRRVKIKEIKKGGDSDIDDTLDLYEKLFKEEHRILASELIAWLEAEKVTSRSDDAVEQRLLIAKRRGDVVGLLKVLYCKRHQYVFIPYFGVDRKADTTTRRVASKILTRFLQKYAKRKWKAARAIVFEVEMPSDRMTESEKAECRARLRLLRDIARRHGHRAYTMRVEYSQPSMADATRYSRSKRMMHLMIVPLREGERDRIPRAEAEEILRFVLMRVYGTTQTVPARRRDAYNKHLHELWVSAVSAIDKDVRLE